MIQITASLAIVKIRSELNEKDQQVIAYIYFDQRERKKEKKKLVMFTLFVEC